MPLHDSEQLSRAIREADERKARTGRLQSAADDLRRAYQKITPVDEFIVPGDDLRRLTDRGKVYPGELLSSEIDPRREFVRAIVIDGDQIETVRFYNLDDWVFFTDPQTEYVPIRFDYNECNPTDVRGFLRCMAMEC